MAVSVRYIGTALPLHEVAFFRSIIPVIIISILIMRRGESFFPAPRKPLVLRGIFGTGGLICFFHATQHLPLSVSGILIWCTPVVTYFTARIALGEKLAPATLLWLMVALFGLMLIFFPIWFTELEPSSALAQINIIDFSIGLLGTLCAGLVFVTIRSAAASHNNSSIVLSFSVTASVITGIWMTFSYEPPSEKFFVILIFIGIVGTLAQLALTEAYRNAPAALVSSMSLMQAPFTIVWGVLVFSESLTLLHILGIALMGVGVAFASHMHAKGISKRKSA